MEGSTAFSAAASLDEAAADVRGPPQPIVLATIAFAGCAAAAFSFTAALRNPAVGAHLGEPLVIAFLSNWLTVSYLLCGLFAWARRPLREAGLI